MSKTILTVNVDYHIDRLKILQEGPRWLAEQLLYNASSVEQSMSFAVDESTEKESSFSHQVGASLTVGTEFEAGVPFFAKGKWSVSLTASYSFTWGTVTRERRGWTGTFPVVVVPNAVIEAVASVHQSNADIPYTMTVRYTDGSEQTSTGVYHGVDQYQLSYLFKPELFLVVKDRMNRNHKIGVNMEFFCTRDQENVILQKDFESNKGVGVFNVVDLQLGNTCPRCHSTLRVADFRKFWFNQCTVKYLGIDAATETIKEGAANFSAEPAEFAALDQKWYSLNLDVIYYRPGWSMKDGLSTEAPHGS